MQINVYIANLAKYNEGKLVGRWVTLPMERHELKQCIRDVLGKDEEYAIHDYESPFAIGEYEDVFAINDDMEILNRYDDRLVAALCEFLGNRDEVIQALQAGEFIVYYDIDDLTDVAEQMAEEGLFGHVPPSLMPYLDYGKIARDLQHDGWYLSRQLRIAVRLQS
ncbi:antirestriction protein ArdA [Paenibacillus macerans]|uniref:Antirestriction protein ArdA n=1 Tax=Paenibacillus thermoaerophilus TaxID=1215385 RepID=A0ABW2VAA7_9BACL|nr:MULTISPECIES: antirestriction protein ArdA [Paenibacillus]MEC0140917.1 antirestriction protein ArdA [Paenibacillus macerans]TMV06642.1 antirestriction protein ArdA [Paenibacillus thermoaerophilus]GIP10360.1 antirestriction protein ArdA [Paenibacillus macerans]